MASMDCSNSGSDCPFHGSVCLIFSAMNCGYAFDVMISYPKRWGLEGSGTRLEEIMDQLDLIIDRKRTFGKGYQETARRSLSISISSLRIYNRSLQLTFSGISVSVPPTDFGAGPRTLGNQRPGLDLPRRSFFSTRRSVFLSHCCWTVAPACPSNLKAFEERSMKMVSKVSLVKRSLPPLSRCFSRCYAPV